jgi:NMD protein affecting ribosome stability and mRNA decay
MNEKKEVYECIMCGRKITKEEYETFDGLCQECYEIEIEELDFDEEEA